jgi:hypothetical protein
MINYIQTLSERANFSKPAQYFSNFDLNVIKKRKNIIKNYLLKKTDIEISTNKPLYLDLNNKKIVLLTAANNQIINLNNNKNSTPVLPMNVKPRNLMRLILNFNSELPYYQSIVYNFKNGTKLNTYYKNFVIELLNDYFYSVACLISKPVFICKPNQINIRLYYYLGKINNKYIKLNINKLNLLAYILSCFFKKEIELDLVRLYNPFKDPNILAHTIGSNSKRIKFYTIMKKVNSRIRVLNPKSNDSLKTAPILSFLNNNNIIDNLNTVIANSGLLDNSFNNKMRPIEVTGYKVRLAGRLTTQKVVPRKTVKTFSRGTFVKNKVNFVNTASFTSKNKNGAHRITIDMSHTIIN